MPGVQSSFNARCDSRHADGGEEVGGGAAPEKQKCKCRLSVWWGRNIPHPKWHSSLNIPSLSLTIQQSMDELHQLLSSANVLSKKDCVVG